MKSSRSTLRLPGLDADLLVWRRPVKRLRVTVLPPDGQVRVSVPPQVSDAQVMAFLEERRDWIRGHRQRLMAASGKGAHSVADGSIHTFWGLDRRLEVSGGAKRASAVLDGPRLLVRLVDGADDAQRRRDLIDRLKITEVRREVGPLLEYWSDRMELAARGLPVTSLSVRAMRTRWGSCTPSTRRIRINSALATRRIECLDYVLVHELVHLEHEGHGTAFTARLDGLVPGWRSVRRELDGRV